MKTWQKGIELEKLLELEKMWIGYNEKTLSPFLQMKKNSIASVIDAKMYDYTEDYAIYTKIYKVKSKIKMYSGYDIIISSIEPGERVINKISYKDKNKIIEKIKSYEENTFLYVHEEDDEDKNIVDICGFKKIGEK